MNNSVCDGRPWWQRLVDATVDLLLDPLCLIEALEVTINVVAWIAELFTSIFDTA